MTTEFIEEYKTLTSIEDKISHLLTKPYDIEDVFELHLLKTGNPEETIALLDNEKIRHEVSKMKNIKSMSYHQDYRLIIALHNYGIIDLNPHFDVFLNKAATTKNIEFLEFLLSITDSIEDAGFIHSLCIDNEIEILKILLDSDKFKPKKEVLTVIHFCFKMNNFEIINFLISYEKIHKLLTNEWIKTLVTKEEKQFFKRLISVTNF